MGCIIQVGIQLEKSRDPTGKRRLFEIGKLLMKVNFLSKLLRGFILVTTGILFFLGGGATVLLKLDSQGRHAFVEIDIRTWGGSEV